MRIKKVSQATLVAGEVIQESGTPSNTNVYSSNAVLEKIETKLITGEVTETKETIDGAKVYVKVIDIGTLPNATRKIIHSNTHFASSFATATTKQNIQDQLFRLRSLPYNAA